MNTQPGVQWNAVNTRPGVLTLPDIFMSGFIDKRVV